jgi:hypothetical protein
VGRAGLPRRSRSVRRSRTHRIGLGPSQCSRVGDTCARALMSAWAGPAIGLGRARRKGYLVGWGVGYISATPCAWASVGSVMAFLRWVSRWGACQERMGCVVVLGGRVRNCDHMRPSSRRAGGGHGVCDLAMSVAEAMRLNVRVSTWAIDLKTSSPSCSWGGQMRAPPPRAAAV